MEQLEVSCAGLQILHFHQVVLMEAEAQGLIMDAYYHNHARRSHLYNILRAELQL
jgi:hypothetical protein